MNTDNLALLHEGKCPKCGKAMEPVGKRGNVTACPDRHYSFSRVKKEVYETGGRGEACYNAE